MCSSLGVSPAKISLGIPSYSDWWYPTYDAKAGARARGNDISFAKAERSLATSDAGARGTIETRCSGRTGRWPA